MRKAKKIVMALSTFLPSKIRVLLYRSLGVKIGRNVKISPFSILIADRISIGDYCHIRPFVLVNIGYLEMDTYSIIASLSAIFGDSGLVMEKRSRVGHANLLDCSDEIRLGHYCGLGPRNTLYTHASWLPLTMGYPNLRKPINLGNYVWTGIGVTVFPGTTTGDHIFTHANMVLSGKLEGESFHTPGKILPISKIQKPMDAGDVITRVVKEIAKKLPVYFDKENEERIPPENAKIIVITGMDDSLIRQAAKRSIPVVAFMNDIGEELRDNFEKRNVDWYDFNKIEMSSLSHRHKDFIMTKLVTWGGLRFLEK